MEAQTSPQAAVPLKFTASGAEYFRIWIVNLALTVVTLGLYSAWAKVRRMKYFYQNTQLAGAAFNYHGDPKAILKGRFIALMLLSAWNVAPLDRAWGMAVWIALAAVWPWIMVRSLRFKRHNSSYRNVRFRFDGKAREVYLPFGLLLGALFVVAVAFQYGISHRSAAQTVLGFGAGLLLVGIAPHFHFVMQQFAATHTLFGQTRARFKAGAWDYYKVYLLLAGIVAGGVALIAAVLGGSFALGGREAGMMAGVFIVIAALLLIYGFFLFVGPYFQARFQNLTWNNLRLGAHRFRSDVRVWPLFRLTLANLILTGLTLGFYRPFAVVRTLRYRIEAVSLVPAGDLDSFVGASEAEVAAVGEEAVDLFDLDIAL